MPDCDINDCHPPLIITNTPCFECQIKCHFEVVLPQTLLGFSGMLSHHFPPSSSLKIKM